MNLRFRSRRTGLIPPPGRIVLLLVLSGCLPYPAPPPVVRPNQAGPDPVIPGANARSLDQVPAVDPGSVMVVPEPRDADAFQEIQPGETLADVARRFNTTVDNLMKLNAWDREPVLQDGQFIRVR